jgi:hypothetical protein
MSAVKHLSYADNSYKFNTPSNEKTAKTVFGAELFGFSTKSVSQLAKMFASKEFLNKVYCKPIGKLSYQENISKEYNAKITNQITKKIYDNIDWEKPVLEYDSLFFKSGVRDMSYPINPYEFKMKLMSTTYTLKDSEEKIKSIYTNMCAVYEKNNHIEKTMEQISKKISPEEEKDYKIYEARLRKILPKSNKYKGFNIILEKIMVEYIEYLTLYAMHFPADSVVAEIISGGGNSKRGSRKFKADYPGKSLLHVLQEKKLNCKDAYNLIKPYVADALLSGNHMAELSFFSSFLYNIYGVPSEFTNLFCSGGGNHYFALTGGFSDTPGYYTYKHLKAPYENYNNHTLTNCCGYLSRLAIAEIWWDMYEAEECPKELIYLKENFAEPIKQAYSHRDKIMTEF